MGGRLLRKWLGAPLIDIRVYVERQDAGGSALEPGLAKPFRQDAGCVRSGAIGRKINSAKYLPEILKIDGRFHSPIAKYFQSIDRPVCL